MVGRTVFQYQLGEKLGSGGMGEVYRALDTRLNRQVAIKVLSGTAAADPEFRRRFIHEAQAASALNHPNILTIYDVLDDGETQYMVTELVDGRTLLELIPAGGMAPEDVVRYAAQMADALSAAHAAGIIHRDLKPANVMVNRRGHVKLLDFGLAKLTDPEGEHTGETTLIHNPLTIAGAIMGTANYMSPEQAEGRKLDGRSDIFTFGALLYEMVTGRPAFKGESIMATITAILRDEVAPLSGPPVLAGIVARCLQKNPADRFQNMRQVEAALAEIAIPGIRIDSGSMSPPTVRTVAAAPVASAGKSKSTAIAGVALLVALAGGAAWWWSGRARPVNEPAAGASHDSTLTNKSIADMVAARVAPSLIISQIRSSKTNFDLSADGVIGLTKAGVPTEVIEAMRDPEGRNPPPPVTKSIALMDGLTVRLALGSDIPDDAPPGAPLKFTVESNVRIDGSTVIAKGARAEGAIVDGAKRKIFGIGGKMTLRLESVDGADGTRIALRATAVRSPEGNAKRPLIAGGKKPKGVASVAGTEYIGYVDGTQNVTVKVPRDAVR